MIQQTPSNHWPEPSAISLAMPASAAARRARRRPLALAVSALMLAAVLASTSGCMGRAVLNIQNSPIGGRYTLDQIADKIVKVAKRRGWRARLVAPGRVEAVLNVRSHMAKIDITFDRNSYSINYVDSTNLNYDGARIHRNYNGWIKRLDDDLRIELNF